MGDIRFVASQELPDFPYASFAESVGFRGIRVEKPEQLAAAWDQALSGDRPVILEAITDPDTPTLPPHITFEQAKNFTETLLKGDPDEGGIVRHAIKEVVQSLVSHSS